MLGVEVLGVVALGFVALGVAALGFAVLGFAVLGVAVLGVAVLGFAALGVAADLRQYAINLAYCSLENLTNHVISERLVFPTNCTKCSSFIAACWSWS